MVGVGFLLGVQGCRQEVSRWSWKYLVCIGEEGNGRVSVLVVEDVVEMWQRGRCSGSSVLPRCSVLWQKIPFWHVGVDPFC